MSLHKQLRPNTLEWLQASVIIASHASACDKSHGCRCLSIQFVVPTNKFPILFPHFNCVAFPQAFERNPEPVIPEMQQSEGPLQMNGGRQYKLNYLFYV